MREEGPSLSPSHLQRSWFRPIRRRGAGNPFPRRRNQV